MKIIVGLFLLVSMGAAGQTVCCSTDTVPAWIFVSQVVRDTTKPWMLKGVPGFAIMETKLDSTSKCEAPRVATIDKQVYLDDKRRPITSSYVVKYVEAREQ